MDDFETIKICSQLSLIYFDNLRKASGLETLKIRLEISFLYVERFVGAVVFLFLVLFTIFTVAPFILAHFDVEISSTVNNYNAENVYFKD